MPSCGSCQEQGTAERWGLRPMNFGRECLGSSRGTTGRNRKPSAIRFQQDKIFLAFNCNHQQK